MTDSPLSYTSSRIALASGILGAVGATLGWLAWLAVQVASWQLAATVLVGAALGLTVHWLQHYVTVARRERRGEPPGDESGDPRPPARSLVALSWAAGFGFLGLVTEHLVAHMAAEFLQPFLASLATLLPAGVILGWTMNRGRPSDENLFLLVANGVMVGVAISVVTGVIWIAGFGTAPWLPLLAWWGLIGIGTRLVTRRERNAASVGDPIVAVVLVFAATFAFNLLPATTAPYQRFGAFGTLPLIVRSMAAEVQQSPALPATFWIEAEARFLQEKNPPGPATPVAGPARPLDTARLRSTAPTIDLKGAVDRLVDPDTVAHSATIANVVPPGARSAFYRSWLVILLFALGLGLAPLVERSLRPVDYPSSETYRKDVTLAIVVALLLVAACGYARFDRSRELTASKHLVPSPTCQCNGTGSAPR